MAALKVLPPGCNQRPPKGTSCLPLPVHLQQEGTETPSSPALWRCHTSGSSPGPGPAVWPGDHSPGAVPLLCLTLRQGKGCMGSGTGALRMSSRIPQQTPAEGIRLSGKAEFQSILGHFAMASRQARSQLHVVSLQGKAQIWGRTSALVQPAWCRQSEVTLLCLTSAQPHPEPICSATSSQPPP